MGFLSSLNFLNPFALILAAAVPSAILLLYFLKLKRREVPVSSTFLWLKAIDDLRVNSPFQKLRQNLLLILQLLIALGVALALARPAANVGGSEGHDLVLVIDRSASMSTRDGGPGNPTRLERAKEEALRLIDDLSIGDRAMVLGFADTADQLQNLTDVKGMLRRAVAELEPTHRGSDLHDALAFAASLTKTQQGRQPEVVVFSDGALENVAELPESDLPVRYVRIGEPAGVKNFAITGLDRRRSLEGGDIYQIFVEVANTGDEDGVCGISLYLDDHLIDAKEVDLKAGRTASVLFERPSLTEGIARVQLEGEDWFELDDKAWTILTPQRLLEVLLVTADGNYFIHNILRIDPLVDSAALKRIAPEEFKAAESGIGDYDLVIFDRTSPGEALPPGSYLFLDAVPLAEGLGLMDAVEHPDIVEWDESHPATRFTDLSLLAINTAHPIQIRTGDRVVLQSTAGPLIVEPDDPTSRSLILGFDIYQTSWPLQSSFPIFFANVLRWLSAAGAEQRGSQVRTGDTVRVPLPKQGATAKVTGPDDEVHEIEPGRPEEQMATFSRTDLVGIYDVEGAEGGFERFAVNVLSRSESDIKAREQLTLRDKRVAGEAKAEERNREIWWWFAAVAFAFVLFEWWIYNRRVYL